MDDPGTLHHTPPAIPTMHPQSLLTDRGVGSLDQEIRTVVRSLCQGTADEQRRTLERYFTKDASFIHPFCIVPHFHERHVHLLGTLSSRDVVRSIFQWYRMLSPKIDIEIDTVCAYICFNPATTADRT